ncbi:MAG: gliding motility-associated C-terminal domain-containing protein [Bacteroidales bacterium]|nr:gliding motility-associated C-terminal domain-containing protein [Bacteroidales bacterium]
MKKVRILFIVLLGMLYQVCSSQIYIFGWPQAANTLTNYSCWNGDAYMIIRGGQPRTTFGTYYTITNTGAGTMETSANLGDNCLVVITGLTNGQTYSIHVTDGLGNSKDFSDTYNSCTCQTVNFCRWTGSWKPCTALPTTMSCTDPQITLYAEWPTAGTRTEGFNNGDIQTGWEFIVSCNANANNVVKVYENGVYQFDMAVPANTLAYPSANLFVGVGFYFDVTSTYRFDLCEGTTTGDYMSFAILDKHSGHVLVPEVVWNNKDGACQSVTYTPPPNYTGIAQFTGPGVTTENYGFGYFNPAVAGPGVHTITYNWDNQFPTNPCSGSKSYVITVTNPYNCNITYPKNSYCISEPNPTPTITGVISAPGSFSSTPAGLSINAGNGTINLAGSTPGGPYKVLYTVGSLPCGDTASFMITIFPRPTITISGNTPLCSGNSDVLTASGATSYTWSGGLLTNPITVTPTVTTTYYVTGSDGNGCSNTAQTVVTVNPNPPVTATGAIICLGATTNITAANANTYTWSTTQNGATVSVNPTVTTTYTVTGSNASGCTGTASCVVTVNPFGGVTATGGTMCLGTTATITGVGASTYTWNNGVGAGNPRVVNPNTTTTYIVTGTNASGCTGTASCVVTVNPLPPVTATGGTICIGGTTAITAGGASTYLWDNGVGATNPANVSPTVTTIYRVTGTDVNGCTNAASCTVTVNPLPNITATGGTICVGASINISAGGGTIYTWDSGSNSNPYNVAPNVTTIYNVTGTNGLGCTNTASCTVTVNPLPNVTATGGTICRGVSINITAAGANTYFWNTGSNSNPYNVSPIATTTYFVTGTDNNSCTNVANCVVTVNQLPNITATGGEICLGASTNITANGGASYIWNIGAGQTLAVTPASTTTYYVTGTDANTCTGTASAVVRVNPLPIISATDKSICFGRNTTLTANTSSGTAPFNYLWTPGSLTGQTVTVTPAASTTYSIVITDTKGCTGTATVSVTVSPQMTATISGKLDAKCQLPNGNATVTASGGIPIPGTSYNYLWSPGGYNTALIDNISSGTYTVTVTDAIGCTATTSVVIGDTPPIILAVTSTPEHCGHADGSATVFASGGTVDSYLWSNGETTQTISNLPQGSYYVTVTMYGICTEVASVSVNEKAGPTADFGFTPSVLDVFENTIALFDDYSSPGGQPITKWHWDFGEDSATADNQTPSHEYLNIGTYTVCLRVTDSENCMDSICKPLIVKDIFTVYIPNAFSPNEDVLNDLFIPQGYNIDPTEFLMIIFNRWGEEIYKTNDINIPWNGRFNNTGKVVQIGVYVYKVKVKEMDGPIHTFIGRVSVLR